MSQIKPTQSTKTFEQFWTAKLRKDKVWLGILSLASALLLGLLLYFSRKDAGFRLTCWLLLGAPVLGYALMTRIYLLRSPLMTDNLLILRKEDISNAYFRLNWGQIEKIDYQLIKRRSLYVRDDEPFLLLSLKYGCASEYLRNVPFFLRREFFRLKSVKDPQVIPISLKLISREPLTIFQVAQMFHGSLGFPAAQREKS